jgi:TubC N-terminal docking domain
LNAAGALEAARAAGLKLVVEGDALALSAASAPPAEVLAAISRHKAEIIALLRPGRDGWSAEDWQVYFDERTGIAEFDGRLPRVEAEARAFECCVTEWLNRNPVCSSPGRCLECGGKEDAWDKLLPYGAEPTGHAWLHPGCWETWHANRKAKAVAALSPILGAG